MDLNSFIKYLPSSFSDSEGWMIYNSGTEELYKWSESASEVTQFCPTLCDPMDSSLHQAPPSKGFSRQEFWSGLPFPSPGNLPDPGIEPRSPAL